MNPSARHASESLLSQSAADDLDAVYTRIAKRIIPFGCAYFTTTHNQLQIYDLHPVGLLWD
jgi:hypothetical protein